MIPTKRIGVARAINKAGYCSRSNAEKLVSAGEVTVNGVLVLDPEFPTTTADQIYVQGNSLQKKDFVYVMLNKPRGLITSASDEQGRDTIYTCIAGLDYPHLGPVGRLDKASEGLLLLTNDTEWANHLLDPLHGIVKTYHVQVDGIPPASLLLQMEAGIQVEGMQLKAEQASIVRQGDKNAWLEIKLSEGKNREIRRMLESLGLATLRLIRIALGPLTLGDLPKGASRPLTKQEIERLSFIKTPCI